MSAVAETSFFAPKMSDFLILNKGGRLTRTEQLTDCRLDKKLKKAYFKEKLPKAKTVNFFGNFCNFTLQGCL